MATEKQIREVKRRYAKQLLSQPGVSGVGIEKADSGDYVLAVHLNTDDPQVRKKLPDEIEGYRIRYVYSGPFRKLPVTES
jgi:hypothetical protein